MTAKPATKNKPRFKPHHPEKYKGDPTTIYYRSGWELSCMVKFDSNPNVVEWSSEEHVVPYRSKIDVLKEQRGGRYTVHRYYIDFYVKLRDPDGTYRKLLIEVKPMKETEPPDRAKYKGRNADRRYQADLVKFEINRAKWAAARKYAEDRNMKFEIFTEKKIYG